VGADILAGKTDRLDEIAKPGSETYCKTGVKTGVRDILFSMIACMAALRGNKGRGLAAYSPS
jgi:hypothetical protein